MMSAALERSAGHQFSIEYYTDPLCCWSWALEPVWRQIERRHPDNLSFTVVLGGMIESWTSFRDPINDVASPPQLAPLWQLAGQMTGVPIDPFIWHVDPPASSYPASVAVKAAGLQSAEAAMQYLRLAREAVMTRRLNIARREVLLGLADELAIATGHVFEAERFEHDLERDEAIEAFRSDLQRTRFRRIGRFPTIVVHGGNGSRLAIGYRSVDALDRMVAAVSQP